MQGETPALTPFVSELGTHITAMPTYTYSRMPGAISIRGEEEIWRPSKWKDYRLYNRFAPVMNWQVGDPSLYFFTGNEIGDELWQELLSANAEANRTPMLYGGFTTPNYNGFWATFQGNQVDHFSNATFDERKKQLGGKQDFAWFGENLPAYSSAFGGVGYNGSIGNFSVLAGKEFIWAWRKIDSTAAGEWTALEISPRVEINGNFFLPKKLNTEFFVRTQNLNPATENLTTELEQETKKNNETFVAAKIGGESFSVGVSADKINKQNDEVYYSGWFEKENKISNRVSNYLLISRGIFSDSLWANFNTTQNTQLTLGTLINGVASKFFGNLNYKIGSLNMETKHYLLGNFDNFFLSYGSQAEIYYLTKKAKIGAAASGEEFSFLFRDGCKDNSFLTLCEWLFDEVFYNEVLPAQKSAKFYINYNFRSGLTIQHELAYRSKIQSDLNIPSAWFWNAQIEQKIPNHNAYLYAVFIHILSKDEKEFSFGGIDRARFYCGLKVEL
ncbi:hypothetical protein AGMMS49938_08300 [Fibrobacterales bacterium]|nr:hypothetical protein AGMMS49938_08300 [Fibrobacterales bacterium]